MLTIFSTAFIPLEYKKVYLSHIEINYIDTRLLNRFRTLYNYCIPGCFCLVKKV